MNLTNSISIQKFQNSSFSQFAQELNTNYLNNPFKKKSQVKLCEEGYKIKTYFIFLIYTFHFLIQFQRKTGSLYLCFSQFSCSVVSYSLQPCGLQHARLPCPSLTPRACSNSCPLSQHVRWMVIPSNLLILCRPLLLLPSIFPSIRVFSNESVLHIRWPKYWSFSFSLSPSKKYSGLISLQSKGLSRVFSNTTVQKHQFKVMSLLFNTLSRLVIAFLPRSKHLLISWLQSPSAVMMKPRKIKSLTVSTVSPSICHEVMGSDAMTFVF